MRVYTADGGVYEVTANDEGWWSIELDGAGWRMLTRPPRPVVGENLRFTFAGGGFMMVDEVIDIEYPDDAG
jgi:hypothetical protein